MTIIMLILQFHFFGAYCISLSIFMMNKTQWHKTSSKSQNGQIGFFFLLSSDWLAQYGVSPLRWFLHKTFYGEDFMTLLFFHNFQVPQSASNHTLKNYSFNLDAIFFICTHTQLNHHLAMNIAELGNVVSGPIVNQTRHLNRLTEWVNSLLPVLLLTVQGECYLSSGQ